MEITHTIKTSGTFPLTSTQNRIWFMEHFDRNITAYNIPLDFRMTGDPDLEIFVRSLDLLVERHEALRTVFPKVNGLPVQKILPELPVMLHTVHLEDLPEDQRKDAIDSHSLSNANHKFDLEKGPLFRFEILFLGNREYIFLANFHHLILDAVSTSIFFDELELVYTALLEGKPVRLSPLPVTYSDYALWQHRWLEGEECKNQIGYWKKELAGVPDVLKLPVDYRRPKIQTYNGAEFHFEVDAKLREKLVALSKKHGTSLSVPLLTAYAVLLSRYSAQEDFVIGFPIANRNHYELESLLGILINTLPLRFTVSGDLTFSDAVEKTKKTFLAAYDNQEVPFEKLVEEMKVKRAMDYTPVFQVIFNFLADEREEIRMPGLVLQRMQGRRVSAQLDLILTVTDRKDSLGCMIEYNTDLFRKDTVEKFAGHWMTLLEGGCAMENRPVDEIPILTAQERQLMFVDWNRTEADYPKDKCIHHLFEDQVKRSPDAVAASDDHETLTYSQLNSRANRFARYLAGRGAEEGRIVAVFLDRGMDLLTSLLAVAKTGATYLPVDAIYPKARLELILEDAKPVLVVTQTSLLENLPETGNEVVLVDDRKVFSHPDDSDLGLGDPQSPAYILYTSGSTG
ncbi:MAG TPA: condensation domain-containing protein, partial [Bacteroidales bacterium]|nr:condensation domain-containing protein [Bacteroidales bacterium]